MGTNQKLTAKQKAERIKAAQEREAREKARREAAARTKKIFTVVVCVILVLALGIPCCPCSNPWQRITPRSPNAASRAELFCKGSAREGGRGVCVTMNGCRAQA